MCRIVVDSFERSSGMPEELAALGVEIAIETLGVGDYDLGGGLLVERKTVFDLCLSVQRGRFWRQLDELRRAALLPHVLIEGQGLDTGSMSPRAVRGACLAVVGLGIPLLRSDDVPESALWLSLLARRRSSARARRDRPIYAQKPKPALTEVPEAMLSAVPGISVKRARALLKEFGNVSGVVAAGPAAWMGVEGIGPKLADRLARAIF